MSNSSERPASLDDYARAIAWPVQWGDQDAFGHVNNTVYFRWMETGRIVYMDEMGLSALMASERIGPILAAISCQYRQQLNYPDTVWIGTRVSRMGRSSIGIEHRIVSGSKASVVAEGDSTIVTFDYAAQKPCPIPADIRAAIERIEGREFPTG